jgi:hypothetical protein
MKYAKWLIIDAVLICVLVCVWHWYWEKYIPSISDTEDEVIEEIIFCPPPPQIVICEEAPRLTYPEHWGPEPNIQLKDYVKLPEPYGHGSSTLKHWIEKNQKEDANPPQEGPRAQEHLGSFNIPDTVPNRVLPQQQ